MDLFRIENLSFRYPAAEKNALSEISLSVEGGSFVVLCGQSGCGKTTLLKMLKRELSPHGSRSGEIFYNGLCLQELSERKSACEIGYVLQNPESQTVTDKVWHELAFGLENMGAPTSVIRRRVGEMASFFGIQDWFRKNTSELSGGQKQLLNLASIMVMQPKVLILDEPTSQLDPIAAADFIATLQKLNKDLGLTILLAEHRLEEVFPIADRVLVMEEGGIAAYEPPRSVERALREKNPAHPMLKALPSAVRIFCGVDRIGDCPLTVKEGRRYLSEHWSENPPCVHPAAYMPGGEPALELKEVWFRYSRDLPDVLRGVTFSVCKGESFCILGGNGTGKTTMLDIAAGLRKAYRGKVLVAGKPLKEYRGGELYRHHLALLPQNPQTVFLKKTVEADFEEICKVMEYSAQERADMIESVSARLGIEPLQKQHPYDLSGGEQQKCALAKMLLLRPRILLLDEPTKGIDAFAKLQLLEIIRELKKDGIAIVTVTHDVEFACMAADRCALFFDGEIVSDDVPRRFFAENNFYTTAANRIARHLDPFAVTVEDVVAFCRGGK